MENFKLDDIDITTLKAIDSTEIQSEPVTASTDIAPIVFDDDYGFVADDDIIYEAPGEYINGSASAQNKTNEEWHKIFVGAIAKALKQNPKFNKTNDLVETVYAVLTEFYVNKKRFVCLEAPTGSGKSIIGMMVNFCVQEIENIQQTSYLLTSSKMLQQQFDGDLDRFNLRHRFTMLKGPANYPCTMLMDETKGSEGFISYSDRFCMGMNTESKSTLPCFEACPYYTQRDEASQADCTILNYSYFLNVMRRKGIFFETRRLTISDEAHLIPDIVCGQFNYEFNRVIIHKIEKAVMSLEIGRFPIKSDTLADIKKSINECHKYFLSPITDPNKFIEYIEELLDLRGLLMSVYNGFGTFQKEQAKTIMVKLLDELAKFDAKTIIKLVAERPDDVFVMSEEFKTYGGNGSEKFYRHFVRDLSEAELVRDNFLSKTKHGLLMSATLGNIEEYAVLMGLRPNEYAGLRLPSRFDFSNSPVFLCKSGWLNYANFDKNIDNVLMDAIKICENHHGIEKGIIHTSTFKIAQLLETKILNGGLVKNIDRYLFYKSAEQKEQFIELMKTAKYPYVIVGPSLYEGIDLKDDQGRFNILVKVPYPGMDAYIRKKMERYPFFYNRITIEKIIQSIGRTNRHVNDYSKVYLLDSLFEKIIWETTPEITARLQYLKIR